MTQQATGNIMTFISPRRRVGCVVRWRAGPRSTAFTVIELLMGMVITALVMAALSAVMTAVAQGWTDAQGRHAEFSRQNAITVRINAKLQGARRIWQIRPGGSATGSNTAAAIVYANVDPDGSDTLAPEDVHVLILNKTRGTLDECDLPAGIWGSFRIQTSMLSASLIPEVWQSLCSTPVPLAGSTQTSGAKVSKVTFAGWPNNGTDPATSVEYLIEMTTDGVGVDNYGTVTLRAPWRAP